MNSKQKNTLTMIVIVVAFLSPVVLSYWMVNQNEVLEARGQSNNGELITPPRPIENLSLIDPVANENYQLHGKWSMVYVSDTCDKACMDNLYRMRQIHIAMDKHSLRVQRVLLMTAADAGTLTPVLNDYAGQRIIEEPGLDKSILLKEFKLSEVDQPLRENRLYVIDPLGNLMMSYSPDVDPRGIMDDLKKLLKASRIG